MEGSWAVAMPPIETKKNTNMNRTRSADNEAPDAWAGAETCAEPTHATRNDRFFGHHKEWAKPSELLLTFPGDH